MGFSMYCTPSDRCAIRFEYQIHFRKSCFYLDGLVSDFLVSARSHQIRTISLLNLPLTPHIYNTTKSTLFRATSLAVSFFFVFLSLLFSLSPHPRLCYAFCKCCFFFFYVILSISSASLVYTLDHVTSRLVGDIFSCFFLKVPRAANGQFTYAYQESLRKVRVSRRVSVSTDRTY